MKTTTRWMLGQATVWIGLLLVLGSCGKSDDTQLITPSVSSKLQGLGLGPNIDKGQMIMMNGSYGLGCTHQSTTNNLWSLPVGGYTGVLDHETMQVSVGNVACVLTVTDVKFGFYDGIALNHITQYVPIQGIVLTWAFLETPAAFYDSAFFTSILPGPVVFYANTRISSINGTSFLTNFIIEFDYSSDVRALTGTFQAQLALVTASVQVNQVPPPDYSLNIPGSTLLIGRDGANVVQSISGNIHFLLNTQAGESYVVANTLADITDPGLVAAAFSAGVQTVIPAGPTFDVPGTSLNLLGQSLPTHRYIIVQHTGLGSVMSFEVFDITFNP